MTVYTNTTKAVMTSFMLLSLFASGNMACASDNNNNNEPEPKRRKQTRVPILIDLTDIDEDVTAAKEPPQKKKRTLGGQEQEQGVLEKWTMGSPLIHQTLVEFQEQSSEKYRALKELAPSLLPMQLTSFYNRYLVLEALKGHSEENIRALATGASFLFDGLCGVGSYAQIIEALQKNGGKEIRSLFDILKKNQNVFFPKHINEEERVLIIKHLSDAPTSFLSYIAECVTNMPEGKESLSAYVGKLSNQAMLFIIGNSYYKEKKLIRAKAILMRLHGEGFFPATHELGSLSSQQGDEENAKKFWKQAAEKNIVPSMYSLAKILWKNAKTKEEKEEAKQWFAKAGEKNHRLALHHLGHLTYKEGNTAGAKKFFEKASVLGNGASTYALGALAKKAGRSELAKVYFEKAKEQGYVKPTAESKANKQKSAEVTLQAPSKRDNVEKFLKKSQGN